MGLGTKLIVFNNGLTIIGKMETKDAKSVTISKPVQLVTLPNQSHDSKPGQVGMAFAPFLQYTKEWETGIPFIVADILTVVSPVTDLENSYSSAFGSGLVLPPGITGA